MASLKLKALEASKSISAGGGGASSLSSARAFVTSSRPLRNAKTEKEIEETCENVNEAADAVKKGATQFTKMTKEVPEKISESAEKVMGKAKDSVIKTVAEKIKDKIVGK